MKMTVICQKKLCKIQRTLFLSFFVTHKYCNYFISFTFQFITSSPSWGTRYAGLKDHLCNTPQCCTQNPSLTFISSLYPNWPNIFFQNRGRRRVIPFKFHILCRVLRDSLCYAYFLGCEAFRVDSLSKGSQVFPMSFI